jgi:hypothetical protein
MRAAGGAAWRRSSLPPRFSPAVGTRTRAASSARSSTSPGVATFALTAADRDSIWGWLLDADFFDLPRQLAISSRDAPPVGKCALRVDVEGDSRLAEATRVSLFERATMPASRGAQLAVACVRIRRLVERKPGVLVLPKPVAFREM